MGGVRGNKAIGPVKKGKSGGGNKKLRKEKFKRRGGEKESIERMNGINQCAGSQPDRPGAQTDKKESGEAEPSRHLRTRPWRCREKPGDGSGGRKGNAKGDRGTKRVVRTTTKTIKGSRLETARLS